ncbi:MAG TPA: dephospho-CoA kinase [Candidatus Diapherotrites archaeon]|uniref:Dephospho-CoA kinase n=1 Tax=Candidatus Iainarchaeum sp. TaxID=3101447 RepID=A0A7J4JLC3_9ARCH|nr:dephospho-CoA kinase [Candidatus Diapherotrites archaeon]HIH16707.1 dephospho-CoA kinase [Candidatus Diapherotrites archaeon]
MLVVGLTSSIGCGKSTVAGFFRELGAKVIDADAIVSRLYREDIALKKRLLAHFGSGILCKGGIDRKALAAIVFNDRSQLEALNALVHPVVLAEIKAGLASTCGKPLVVLDVPLLVESTVVRLIDCLVVVKCSPSQQLERVMHHLNLSREEALKRISAQLPLREKLKLADYLIDNSGSLKDTRKQVEFLFNRFLGEAQA